MVSWKIAGKNVKKVAFAIRVVCIVKRKTELLPNLPLNWTKSAKLGRKCEALRALDKVLHRVFMA